MGKVTGQALKSVVSNTVGVAYLTSGGVGRIRLTGLIIGPDAATLGTSNRRFEIQRHTSNGTGTSIPQTFLDPADNSSTGTLFGNLSANGTLTSGAIMLTIPLSEQASFRWVAGPDEDIVIPATANSGVHLMTPVAGGNQSVATTWVWAG